MTPIKSLKLSVSINAVVAFLMLDNFYSLIAVEMSIIIMIFLEPVTAPTYHSREVGS